MDHEFARINVHWIRAPVPGGVHSFHVEGLSKHILDDPNGIRAIIRAVKNILDYGTDVRLRSLCGALEAYRDKIVQLRHAAISQARKAQADIGGEDDVPKLGLSTAKNVPMSDVSRHLLQLDNDKGTRSARSLPNPKTTSVSRSGQQQGYKQIRKTRSSTRPQPIEVSTMRAECLNQQGRLFEWSGKQVFVPENQWQRTSRSGKAVLTNSKYNVWCYDV